MVAPVGPLATINCEPRQTRKGAAAAIDSGAGVWRAGATTIPESDVICWLVRVCYSWFPCIS
jgi:hypothetical protein